MKQVLGVLIVATILWSQPSLAAKCKVVTGVFHVWNGYPPSLRLEDARSGTIYGSYERTPLPTGMRQEVIRNGSVKGQFCLKVVGHTVIPTQKKPITLVHIISYSH